MNNAEWIQRLLDQAFATLDFRSLAEHLAQDVILEVTPPGGHAVEHRGRGAVVDYFSALGDIVSFWRVRCYDRGERVVVVGSERFTIPRHGVTLGGEFALLLYVCDGLITRFLIIEDLSDSAAVEEAALEHV
ncbi:MAG TPA: nuclear transport factor 2 family protein [Gemmatimonadales bacterium]|nr:nuclear transport factor 2 family protein [Gemmatimonadales bacterium]